MPQIFRESANYLAKATLPFAGFVLVVIVLIGSNITNYSHRVNMALEQPAPFSHRHHFEELGIDCRYCHTTVETTPFAGVPPTETCMSCHTQIWTTSPLLAVVRDSYLNNEPIVWNRVNDAPGFVYFDHSIHIAKGVSCFSCHGRVDQMNLTFKPIAMEMIWCLTCHRNPEKNVRPLEEIYNPDYMYSGDHSDIGRELVEKYGIEKDGLTNCSVCHN